MNTKLHAVTNANGCSSSFFMTTDQVSDYSDAATLLDDLRKAQLLLGNRGYDADWFRDALHAKGIQPTSWIENPATNQSYTTRAPTDAVAASK